jgi:DNA-binding CsgD family transcriptional regulator
MDKSENYHDEGGSMNMGEQARQRLSGREKEVLLWLKHGKSSWEISVILEISESTVNFHVKNAMRKLNSVSRTQAVAVALENGLITGA